MKWGATLGVVVALFVLYWFPNTLPSNKSTTVPQFCPSGYNHHNNTLLASSKQATTTFATFNAEWLFDGVNDPHRSSATADAHISNVGRWVSALHADVLNVVELENCQVLHRVREHLSETDAIVYVAPSQDTATRQTVGVITNLPFTSPGISQSLARSNYPTPHSRCQYNNPKIKSSGVSKHWFGVLNIDTIGEVLVVGAHLKARPNHPKSCSKREAQARVLVELVKQHGKDRHVILMGDLNDFDGDVLDASSSVPNSDVLQELTTKLDLTNVWTFLQQQDRWSYQDVHRKWPDSSLDHILISSKLVKYVEAVWVDRNATHSDHRPLAVRFRWGNK